MEHIILMIEGHEDSNREETILYLKERIEGFYAGVEIKTLVIGPQSSAAEDGVDRAYEIAALAEIVQRESAARLIAYLLPLNLEFSGFEDVITIMLIAVADKRGLGSFRAARLIALDPLPASIGIDLLEEISILRATVDPRQRRSDNDDARLLADRIVDVFESLADRTAPQ